MIDDLDGILHYIDKKQCIFFIGAGISAIAGCKLWGDLADSLLNNQIIDNEKKLALESQYPNDYSQIIEEAYKIYSSKNSEPEYLEILRLILNEDKSKYGSYCSFIEKITQINPFPLELITINIDDLLSRVKNEIDKLRDYRIIYKRRHLINHVVGSKAILHIHGMRDDLDNALFVKSKINRRYKDTHFIHLLNELFKKNSILFLGVGGGLDDPNLLRVCKRSNKTHFALVSSEAKKFSPEKMAQYLNEYHIRIVEYGSTNDFKQIFESWVDRKFPPSILIEPKESDLAKI